MSKRRLFMFLASASGYIGIGMLLAYLLGDQSTNTPLWIGVVLTLLGALLLGMFISARADKAHTSTPVEAPQNTYTPTDNEIR